MSEIGKCRKCGYSNVPLVGDDLCDVCYSKLFVNKRKIVRKTPGKKMMSKDPVFARLEPKKKQHMEEARKKGE